MRLLSFFVAATLSLFPLASSGHAEGGVMYFESEDPAMAAAMAAARKSLPVFLDQAAKSDLSQGDFLVKWAHPVDNDTPFEHIWVTVFSLTDTSVIGELANQPVGFAGNQGDPVEVALTDLSDWAYWDASGMMHGSYTTRVMVPQLSDSDQAYFASILAPLP